MNNLCLSIVCVGVISIAISGATFIGDLDLPFLYNDRDGVTDIGAVTFFGGIAFVVVGFLVDIALSNKKPER